MATRRRGGRTLLLFLLTATALISDDVSFANLDERKSVQLVTQRGESLSALADQGPAQK